MANYQKSPFFCFWGGVNHLSSPPLAFFLVVHVIFHPSRPYVNLTRSWIHGSVTFGFATTYIIHIQNRFIHPGKMNCLILQRKDRCPCSGGNKKQLESSTAAKVKELINSMSHTLGSTTPSCLFEHVVRSGSFSIVGNCSNQKVCSSDLINTPSQVVKQL